MNLPSSSATIGHAMSRPQARDLEQTALTSSSLRRSTAEASGPRQATLFSLDKFMQGSLLSRIAIALASAAVTVTVLLCIDALSRPASEAADRQLAKPATSSAPKAAKTRRISQVEAAELVARKS